MLEWPTSPKQPLATTAELEYWVFNGLFSFPYSGIPLFRYGFSRFRFWNPLACRAAGILNTSVLWYRLKTRLTFEIVSKYRVRSKLMVQMHN